MVMAIVVGAPLTFVPVVRHLMTHECATTCTHGTADQRTFATTGKCPNACTAGTTGDSTLASTDGAVVVAGVVMEVALSGRPRRGCERGESRRHGQNCFSEIHKVS